MQMEFWRCPVPVISGEILPFLPIILPAEITDSMELKFHFANGSGDNWDFAGYTGVTSGHMYDDQWHQVVFSL